MPNPNDVFENTSVALSELIAEMSNDDNLEQPVSLGMVRERVSRRLKDRRAAGKSQLDNHESLLRDELQALIDTYGEDALADQFCRPWASLALSRLIEACRDNVGELTLGDVFAEAERGVLADLIGDGEIDDDEAQTVLGELQELIDRHGEDTLAEEFVREP